ncbi:penicillin acylase family protein [Sphingomonas oligoaromativorans]|uniref:penicillin acylase family protein n=1 Tax=Sphingomonas oligoaromativorans TaxID=575322 RepID=UPI00141DD8C9|nr:penicillin acylase family protein [Sphingomonas oligoaromativorans]NIJ33523.1 acyl-homoserine-lactone acylase [Sphingomonas oligoaromativorans]
MDRPTRLAAKSLLLATLFPAALHAATPAEQARWKAEAAAVSITRDDWGIAHVAGRTDADAVFGMIYAQAEDDFGRIEANYLTALGRTAEAEGEKAIWQDLRQRLYVDPAELQRQYRESPDWLRRLMDAWADGLNFYLATHPAVHPKVLTRFEPWMALSFSEGSIGGDIERIPLSGVESFYGAAPTPPSPEETGARPREPKGSNGIAIAPKDSANGHALLLINPHTSFYFRSELQMTSREGLNAYGAVTWGQFFIYQGWNEKTGWMHTSSGVDNVDEFAETIVMKDGKPFYRYGKQLRPVEMFPTNIGYRKPDGSLGEFRVIAYRTHHGPIVRAEGGKWIAEALMWRPIPALEQSFLRTKQSDLASYMKIAGLQANSSNDTLFADQKGEIAYLHPQFVPIRDDRFDYTRPVDGADPATDWKGLHSLASLPQAVNPATGWAFNTNNEPWGAAGPDSPKKADFPRYMDQVGENDRGRHAMRLLTSQHGFTHESLRAAAFDSYLPAFARLLPMLAAAYDALPESDPRRAALAGPIALLRGWDDRWGIDSEATSLAVFWGDTLWAQVGPFARQERINVPDYIATRVPPEAKLAVLQQAVERLTRDFGGWKVPWGRINRFQRLDDSIVPHFDDAKPSIPVAFTSAQWGSLASFGARPYPNTKRYYGTSGNSFVAIVEFGPRVEGWAVTAGGESGDPASRHFDDQAERYATGNLRPVYFWPDELEAHVERRYQPGG